MVVVEEEDEEVGEEEKEKEEEKREGGGGGERKVNVLYLQAAISVFTYYMSLEWRTKTRQGMRKISFRERGSVIWVCIVLY